MIYRHGKTKEISFPLGGIGSGCIGLAGNGALVDWEIFNRPNKGSFNGYSHFAVKAESGGKVVDTRVLVGDLPGPYSGSYITNPSQFGFGPSKLTMQGVPHFKNHEFVGEFPIARINFSDKNFPGRISETAFNPFIPLNDKDSSLPAAFFTFEIKNTTKKTVRYTVLGMLKNPFLHKTVNAFRQSDNCKLIKLSSTSFKETDVEFGNLTIATDSEDVSYQEYNLRHRGFDIITTYWRDLTTLGKLKNRTYPPPAENDEKLYDDNGLLAAHLELKPGQIGSVRFVISWNYPNVTNYWDPEKDVPEPRTWKNYYATIFNDSTESAEYCLENWDRLCNATIKFKKALFATTVPSFVLDAVSANISILKSPTVLRLTDGSLYGFEGCGHNMGMGEGTCTHVWVYAYALPFLFPNLERSIRDLEYKYSTREDGKMEFRLALPVGRKPKVWHACADGQFGTIVRSYREWKISGNDEWLKSNWPTIKKTLEFAWSKTNEDKWDLDKDGVLEGRQHDTLDTELFGPSAYLTGYYLAALKAGAEMAEYFDEPAKAKEYRDLFDRGKAWVDKNLFNGEYFFQKINLKDKTILEPYKEFNSIFGNVEASYWNAQDGELNNQCGTGCHCDQVIAQWHANLCGLGEIFDKKKVKKALRAIYKHNFKQPIRDFLNRYRMFALGDESALVICDWPRGGKPANPLMYCEEAMNGFEYQAAIHMIQEGMVEEGLKIVKAIRDRYDGEKRNPWNEFEYGSSYARSMASYALLPALSGFEFDRVNKHLGFAPVIHEKNFQCFWSLDGAWGTYKRSGKKITLAVEFGELPVKTFSDSLLGKGKMIIFDTEILITPENPLHVEVKG
ncbi:MAG: GH116 family glycosyl-hydrolase [Phycisphaerae bacterium]